MLSLFQTFPLACDLSLDKVKEGSKPEWFWCLILCVNWVGPHCPDSQWNILEPSAKPFYYNDTNIEIYALCVSQIALYM